MIFNLVVINIFDALFTETKINRRFESRSLISIFQMIHVAVFGMKWLRSVNTIVYTSFQ